MRLYLKVELLLIFFFCCSSHCLSQELAIGDACPDVRLINYANGETKSFSLSDLKSKLIILDFWGTGCTSCIQAFPKIDSLQKKFGREVQFILVNKESADSTKRFFSKRNKIRIPDVPMVMGDSVLHKLFPHLFIPHHVWLDSNIIVAYITDGHNATAKNIEDFLNGKDVGLSFKKDMTLYEVPLVSKIPDWTENVYYYSALSRYQPGLDIGNSIKSTVGNAIPNRLSCSGNSILKLFQVAFSEGNKYNLEPSNTIILNVKDKWKYTFPEDKDQYAEWYKSNVYYYELLVPPARASELYKIMQKDLLRYFDVDVRVEKRKIKCLVLKRTSREDKLRSNGGKPQNRLWVADSIKYLKNRGFDEFAFWLKMSFDPTIYPPFINATNYKGNVDVRVNSIGSGTEARISWIRRELKRYDLDLVEESHLTDVLVITEKREQE